MGVVQDLGQSGVLSVNFMHSFLTAERTLCFLVLSAYVVVHGDQAMCRQF